MFMERLCRFSVSESVIFKYHEICEQMAKAESLPDKEIKKRVSKIAFVGYVAQGVKLVKEDSEISELIRRGNDKLCEIPVLPTTNLVNLRVIRRLLPADDLKQIGISRVYLAPAESGIPYITVEDVVAQLSPNVTKRAKAFALRLKDDFVETGYLHMAQAYEFQIELFA